MKPALTLLAMLSIAPLALPMEKEEAKSSRREESTALRTKTAKEGEKKKTARPPAPDLSARIKVLEQENLRLRQEVAKASGVFGAAGSEAASPAGALAELEAGNSRFVAGTRTSG